MYERDNYHCRHCNNTFGLHPHHIVHKGGQCGTDTLDNLVTLCWICHRNHHDGFLDVRLEDGIVKFRKKKGYK